MKVGMTMNKIRLICRKEMRTLFRDKKALLTIFLPILIYPVLLIFFFGFSALIQSNMSEKSSNIALSDNFPQQLVQKFEAESKINLMPALSGLSDLDSNDIDASVVLTQDDLVENYVVYYNSTSDSSQQAANRIRVILNSYSETLRLDVLESVELDLDIVSLVSIEHIELKGETDSRIFSMLLGMILPFIIMLYGITGVYTLSSDLSAGEKERETLETIFSVPVTRFEIIIGKLLACVNVGVISGMVNILAMFPLIFALATAIPDFSIDISLNLLLYLVLMLIPVMIMSSTFFIGLGLIAKTFQESQSYGSVLLIVLTAPTFIVMLPDVSINQTTLLIPVANALLLMKEAFLGNYNLIHSLIVLSIHLGLSLFGVILMNRLFKSDWVIFGGDSK